MENKIVTIKGDEVSISSNAFFGREDFTTEHLYGKLTLESYNNAVLDYLNKGEGCACDSLSQGSFHLSIKNHYSGQLDKKAIKINIKGVNGNVHDLSIICDPENFRDNIDLSNIMAYRIVTDGIERGVIFGSSPQQARQYANEKYGLSGSSVVLKQANLNEEVNMVLMDYVSQK